MRQGCIDADIECYIEYRTRHCRRYRLKLTVLIDSVRIGSSEHNRTGLARRASVVPSIGTCPGSQVATRVVARSMCSVSLGGAENICPLGH